VKEQKKSHCEEHHNWITWSNFVDSTPIGFVDGPSQYYTQWQRERPHKI